MYDADTATQYYTRLLNLPDDAVTEAIHEQLNRISPGSSYGLQGVDASDDPFTRQLWDMTAQAYLDDETATDNPDFAQMIRVVAWRCANAILSIAGYLDPSV